MSTQDTLDMMKEAGVKVTRESFIMCSCLGEPPDPWTALDEGELPDELQDWSLFTAEGGEFIYTGPQLGSGGTGDTGSEDKPAAAAGTSRPPAGTGKNNA